MASKTFEIVINAVTKGFGGAKSLITNAIGGGVKETSAELGKLNTRIKELESDAVSTEKTLGQITAFKKMKTDSAALRDEWNAAQAKVKSLADEISASEKVTKKQTRAFESAKKQAGALKDKYTASETALQGLRGQLSANGVSTKNLASAQGQLSKKLSATKAEINKNKAAFAAAEKPTVGFFQRARLASQAFNAQINKGRTATSKFGTMIKTVLAGVGIKAAVSSLFSAGTEVQRLDRAFESAAGSTKAGAKELEFVRTTAGDLGQEFYSLAGSYKSLYAASKDTNLEGQVTRDIFKGITEASTALGLETEQTTGALKAIEQMMSKGNVQAEELRGQLGERLPGAFNLAADAMGVSTTELNKMLDRGEVLAEDLLPKLAIALHEKYGKAALDASNDAQQGFNRFITAWKDLKVQVAESGFMDVASQKLKELTDKFKDPETIEKIKSLASGVVWLGDVVVTAAINWGKWIAGFAALTVGVNIVKSLVTTTKALGVAFETLTGQKVGAFLSDYTSKIKTAITPTTALGTAIRGVAAAVGAFFAGWEIGSWINSFEIVRQSIQTTYAKIDEFFTNVKIKYLELKKLWNEISGDDAEVMAIEKAIEAEKRHLEAIDRTIDGIWKEKAAAVEGAEATAAATENAAAKKTAVQTDYFDELEKQRAADLDQALENLEEETAAQSTALKQQIANVRLAMAERKLAREKGEAKILEIEKAAAEKRLAVIKAALAEEEKATGDSYDKRADIRKKLQKQIADAELALTEIKIREAEKQTAAIKDAADAEIKEKKRVAEEAKKAGSEELDILKSKLDARLDMIQNDLDQEVITAEEAAEAKLEAELEYHSAVLELMKDRLAAALEMYGQDTEEYKNALGAKLAAEKAFADASAALDQFRVESAQAADSEIVKSAEDRSSRLEELEKKSHKTGYSPEQWQIINKYSNYTSDRGVTNLQEAIEKAKEDPDWPKYGTGGRLGGKPHSQGGTIIEAEEDEYLIPAPSTLKIAREYGWNALESIRRGILPKLELGGRIAASMPAPLKYGSGGAVSAGSAAPAKTVRVVLDLGGGKKYAGIFPENDAEGFLKALANAKSISM